MFAATGATIVAVDISPDLLAKAEKRGLPRERVTFREKQFEDCDLDGPFDAIIGSSVLHHLNVDRAIRRMRDLLKSGGRIAFAEPNMLNPQVYLERKFHHLSMFSYVSPDEIAFVRWSLGKKLGEAGFEDVRIKPFDWLHPATPQSWIGTVRGLGAWMEASPLVREFAGSLIITARRLG
jgi:SAM-dependent methyltransferase